MKSHEGSALRKDLGIPGRYERGELRVNMIKIHCLHVWNCEKINKRYCIKNIGI